jgi:hypothetical protein
MFQQKHTKTQLDYDIIRLLNLTQTAQGHNVLLRYGYSSVVLRQVFDAMLNISFFYLLECSNVLLFHNFIRNLWTYRTSNGNCRF